MHKLDSKRLKNALAAMNDELDALLITNQKNIRYLCGFDFTDGYALITREKSYILADFRYIEAAKEQVGDGFEVVMFDGKLTELLTSLYKENHVHTVGYEDVTLNCARLERMKKDYPDIAFMPTGGIIEKLRVFKDSDEIENIIKAQRIAEMAFEHILGYINPNRTEKDVALELEFFMRSHGAEASAFDVIAISGSNSSRPHGVPRECKLENGFITMDYGAVINGYMSDMTRTVCLGHADDEMKRVYQTVLDAQTIALKKMKSGADLKLCNKKIHDYIDKAGYKGCFGHSLGHGVGMDIHEAPVYSGGSKITKGHVLTCEPGIYIEGKYGVRIEDMVICDESGIYDITGCSKALIEL